MNARPLLATTALLAALSWAAAPALAGKPDWADDHPKHQKGGKGEKHDKHDKRDKHDRDDRYERSGGDRYERGGDRSGVSVNIQIGGYFNDSQRRAALDYYEPQFRSGKCPPGLAKKNNGCLPPGQAKAWRRGYALPPDVVYYPVPSHVSVRLGTPPAGYKYVRVAADILLIAVGTSMVIDAIEDLGRL